LRPSSAISDAPPQRSLAHSAAWVVGCRVVGILATLAGNIVAARLLGPAEFGLYLFLTTVVACGSLIGVAGLNDASLRFLSENLALGRRPLAVAYARRITKFCAASTLLAAGLMSVALALFQFATGRFAQPVLLISLTVVALAALAWQQLAGEMLRGWNDLRLASLFSGGVAGGPLSNLVFLAGIGGLLLTHSPVTSAAALAMLVASVCLTVPAALYCVWRTIHRDSAHHAPAAPAEPTVGLSPGENRQLLSVAGALLVLQLLAFVSQQLDIWIGEALLPPEQLGLYGAAKRSMLMLAMPVQMAMLTIASGIPRLHAQSRRRELQDLLRGSATWAAMPSLAALVLLVLFPAPLLSLVWGGSYAGAAPLVRILAVGSLALILSGNPVHALSLTGRHRGALAINVIAALVMTIAGPLLAIGFGAAGLAWGAAAALAIQNVLLWWLARRELGVWTHVRFPRRTAARRATFVDETAELELSISSPLRPTSLQTVVAVSNLPNT
jgi:O-antigen/teichoic acid export membrane protein